MSTLIYFCRIWGGDVFWICPFRLRGIRFRANRILDIMKIISKGSIGSMDMKYYMIFIRISVGLGSAFLRGKRLEMNWLRRLNIRVNRDKIEFFALSTQTMRIFRLLEVNQNEMGKYEQGRRWFIWNSQTRARLARVEAKLLRRFFVCSELTAGFPTISE